MLSLSRSVGVIAGVLLACGAARGAGVDVPFDAWTHAGGGPGRAVVAPLPAPPIGVASWVRSTDGAGNTITFVGQAGVAVFGGRVYATGRISPPGGPANQYRLFAFAREDGTPVWSAPVAKPVLDSYGAPTVDREHGAVIFASAKVVTAFDAASGAVRWQATLTRNVVNASAVVTDDLGARDRAFITDYDGLGQGGRLYCINVDGFDAALNPWQPGAIVWSVAIGGSSGNSPAYLARREGGVGLVYVAAVGDFGFGGGRVMAFPVDAATAPAPTWTFENTIEAGFFGGVCVVAPTAGGPQVTGGAGRPAVLAASYAFDGGMEAANLVRLDGVTGALAWSTPCNRTRSIPVPLPGGRIALAGGIEGYGTVPSVELFEDLGTSAARVWSTATATWADDGDGSIETGEYLRVGGWTQQPVACAFGGRTRLVVGATPAAAAVDSRSGEMFVLDLGVAPGGAGFVAGTFVGAGGAAAVAGPNAYSVGTAGLAAFGPRGSGLDVDGDGRGSVDDLSAWERGVGARDVDGDGAVSAADRAALVSALRSPERGRVLGAGR